MTGCNDWLDMSPTNKVSEKIVWSDVNYVTQYVNGFYPYISRYGAFETGDSQVGLTDGLTETLKFGSATLGTNVCQYHRFRRGRTCRIDGRFPFRSMG